MITLTFSQSDIDELNYWRFHYPDPIVMKRCETVYLVYLRAKGLKTGDIRHLTSRDVKTIHSPNSNLIERLWKFTKKQCLNNCYYETFEAFKAGIDDCLQNIDKKLETQIASPMTLRLQTFKNDQVMEG